MAAVAAASFLQSEGIVGASTADPSGPTQSGGTDKAHVRGNSDVRDKSDVRGNRDEPDECHANRRAPKFCQKQGAEGKASERAGRRPVVDGMPLPPLSGKDYTFSVGGFGKEGLPGGVEGDTSATLRALEESVSLAASAFRKVGLCIVKGIVPREFSLRALAEANAAFSELQNTMKERNVELS